MPDASQVSEATQSQTALATPAAEPQSFNKSGASTRSHRAAFLAVAGILIVIVATATIFWWLGRRSVSPAATSTRVASPSAATVNPTSIPTSRATVAASVGVQLDPNHNYGDTYANGILPVGDGKYVTDGPKQGYIYACSQYAQNLQTDNGGAQSRGPWFVNNNTEYDLNKKLHVRGSVTWQSQFTNTLTGGQRTITTNDLPNHPTGIFPIASADPAYTYDRNPNHIAAQSLTFALTGDPTYGSPNCIGGTVGVMTTGVALYSAFDAGGRDAGAWEIQDQCSGHPSANAEYHYHTLSSCIKDIGVHTVIGYALDGFPITGPTVGPGNVLTTADLDECHGLTSQVTVDGKTVTTYHYVMTQDFPYSISCFRAKPIQPPGLQQPNTQQGQQQSGPPPRL